MNSQELSVILNKELSALNWTVQRLAKEANVPYETARRAVRGVGNISLESTTRLLVALGKDIAVKPISTDEEVLA